MITVYKDLEERYQTVTGEKTKTAEIAKKYEPKKRDLSNYESDQLKEARDALKMTTKEKTAVEIKLKGLQRKCDAATSELKNLKRRSAKQITSLTSDLESATAARTTAEAKLEDLIEEVKVLTSRTTSKSAKIEYLERTMAKQAAAHAREVERVKLANVRKSADGGSGVASDASAKMLAIQEEIEREWVLGGEAFRFGRRRYQLIPPTPLRALPTGSTRLKRTSPRSKRHSSRKGCEARSSRDAWRDPEQS